MPRVDHVELSIGVIDVRQTMVNALKGEVIIKTKKVALPTSVLEEQRKYQIYKFQERNNIRNGWQGRE